MFEKTKKKLIHFNTSGNIAEDFAASKNQKCARLRGLIRLCFFYHLIMGIGCAAAGYAFDTDSFFTLMLCAVVDIVIAFFAAGGEMTTKAALVGIDIILAAGGTVKAVLSVGNVRVLYVIYGGAALIGAVMAVGEMIAAYLKDYLQDFPIEKLKKEDITLLEAGGEDSPSYELQMNILNSIENRKKQTSAIVPVTGNMRELAAILNGILNGDQKGKAYNPEAKRVINIEDSDNSG